MTRFFLLFIAWQTGLLALELWQPVYENLITPWTSILASIAASIMDFFDSGILTDQTQIIDRATGFAIQVESGCNGVEAFVILAAAVLAYPTSWRHQLSGIALGFLAIQGLNIIRIISLFYLAQWRADWFEWAHLYVWQTLIMLDALLFFLLWIQLIPKNQPLPAK